MTSPKPRVVILRGHQVSPWELRPWEQLTGAYDVAVLQTARHRFDSRLLRLPLVRSRTLRDLLPAGRVGDLAVRLPGDRYLGLLEHLRGADVVHSQELGYWYSMQAARLKPRLGYRLVLTVWETLPFAHAYRNVRTRPYRDLVLERTDLFLAASARARAGLLLEGVAPERIRVSPPGIDLERFSQGEAEPVEDHVILSPGRLVWEKGHQDVIRALALLRRGELGDARGNAERARVLIVGSGPEEARLRRYADELGVGAAVEVRPGVPYDQMPGLYRRASCVVLASLSTMYWEEQFGMVLAEALAAGTPILAASSGAIPEVLAGAGATFAAGDWIGLARCLALGPLAGAPGARAEHPPSLVNHYSAQAAGERLAAAYEEVLAGRR